MPFAFVCDCSLRVLCLLLPFCTWWGMWGLSVGASTVALFKRQESPKKKFKGPANETRRHLTNLRGHGCKVYKVRLRWARGAMVWRPRARTLFNSGRIGWVASLQGPPHCGRLRPRRPRPQPRRPCLRGPGSLRPPRPRRRRRPRSRALRAAAAPAEGWGGPWTSLPVAPAAGDLVVWTEGSTL